MTAEKFLRKANKLISALDLELSERQQVDNVLSFFING